MSDRLKEFTTPELSALVFTMDVAASVEPLTGEAQTILEELVEELKEHGDCSL
jgi:hypothetical protein